MTKEITHDELIEIGRKWLLKPYANMSKNYGHSGCAVIITEIACSTWGGEQPDILGFTLSRTTTILIECKVSLSDFRRDKEKPFRAYPEFGMGAQRWFLAPAGIIPIDEIPERWGLLEVVDNKVKVTKRAELQERNYDSEITVLLSTMRRLNILQDDHISIKRYVPLKNVAPSKNRATFYIDTENMQTNEKNNF